MSFSRTCLILAVWAAFTSSKSGEPDDAAGIVGDDTAPGAGGLSSAGDAATGGSDAASAQGGASGNPDATADLVDSAPDTGPPLARTFTQRTSPVGKDLGSLASNGEVIVATGKAQLIYSDDGVTWAVPDPPVAANAVAFGGGIAWSSSGGVDESSRRHDPLAACIGSATAGTEGTLTGW